MKSYFTADFFINNRQKLKNLFAGTAPILIAGNGLLQQNGDNSFPFRQDSSFWYLTGIDEPDAVLVIDKTREYLILPRRSEVQIFFDGATDTDYLIKRSGIKDIYFGDWKRLGAKLKRVKHIATLPPANNLHKFYGVFPNPARENLISRVRKVNSSLEVLDISKHMAALRSVKQPQEIAAMTQAVNLTAKAFSKVRKKVDKYKSEYQIEADLIHTFRSAGSTYAYPPIVASGVNATTLHYMENSLPVEDNQLLLIDAGAAVEHYAADITRTMTVGKPGARHKSVLQAVADLQRQAFSLLKPGVSLHEFEKKMELLAGEKLRELGLIKTIDRESVRQFYPHATSHFLGLDVHDAGDAEQPLVAGMVLTVEPGIYIKNEGIGVRIEDDVLMTENGIKCLSDKLPQLL